MPKEYYQGRKDRRNEARGTRKYLSGQESRMDSQFEGIIREDHGAPANLPQHVVHHPYPKCSYMDTYELDDTIRGLDDTRNYDIRKIERYASDVKY